MLHSTVEPIVYIQDQICTKKLDHNKGVDLYTRTTHENAYLPPQISNPNQGGDYPTVPAQARHTYVCTYMCMYVCILIKKAEPHRYLENMYMYVT